MTATPFWTTGRFAPYDALDDLGIEVVGPTLMRRLMPGILGATVNAGYYAFYTYLLWKFEQTNDGVLKTEFRSFYRRQEAAYTVACTMHTHRDAAQLRGVQGTARAAREIRGSADTIDVAAVAVDYLARSLGGYSAIYAQQLAAIGLTKLGKGRRVDRVTELGERVARGFADAFEATDYYRHEFDADHVSRAALQQLADACCLCSVPGRADHQPLLDVFLGRSTPDDPQWRESADTRRASIAVFLENHRQHPDRPRTTKEFRALLIDWHYIDGAPFRLAADEIRTGWAAFQLHQCVVYLFTSLWTRYLDLLDGDDRATSGAFEHGIADTVDWSCAGLDPAVSTSAAIDQHAARGVTGVDLLERIDNLDASSADHARQFAQAFDALLALVAHVQHRNDIPERLLAEGDVRRWSLTHLLDWFTANGSRSLTESFTELLVELRYQHYRVAATKLIPGRSNRDPYCCSEEDGALRHIRGDEPFWSDPRYGTMGHLLWTLGLVDAPTTGARPTAMGTTWLDEVRGSDG